jgi:hypothetical protein
MRRRAGHRAEMKAAQHMRKTQSRLCKGGCARLGLTFSSATILNVSVQPCSTKSHLTVSLSIIFLTMRGADLSC